VNPVNHSIAALLGNGVSIAYNPELQLGRINDEICRRLNEEASAGGTEQIQLLQRAASKINTGDPTADFEALLGPFGQYREGIELVLHIARLTGDNSLLQNALQLSADYMESIRRAGVGHALEVIAQQSRATVTGNAEVRDLVDALVAAMGVGRLTIGNLNYDSLVMAALSNAWASEFCDLTDGRLDDVVVDVVPGAAMVGRPLRQGPSFPMNRPIRLLHLHGSLTWLREPGPNGRVFRFDAAGMRSSNYWKAYRDGTTDWTPEVVLTTQVSKSIEVTKYPFSLAYESFFDRLVVADRWFIGGYSFRDQCVNEMLARAWRARKDVPQIYVVTLGKEPRRRDVLSAIGWVDWSDPDPDDFLIINRSGIQSALRSSDWKWFAELPRLRQTG
jgi:SIR2-like domain